MVNGLTRLPDEQKKELIAKYRNIYKETAKAEKNEKGIKGSVK